MILPFDVWIAGSAPSAIDVCIVGAGPAGLELAAALAHGRARIVVLESGALTLDARLQKLSRWRVTGKSLAIVARPSDRSGAPGATIAPRDMGAVRALGGAGLFWAGNWAAPDPFTFEARPWIASSGWPISWSELQPFIEAVAKKHRVPLKALLRERTREAVAAASRGWRAGPVFQQKPPLEFGALHHASLEAAENVSLITGANAIELLPAPGGSHVGEIAVRSVSGKQARLAAHVVVIAAGAIESARLLLASTRFGGRGPGNLHDHLGRGWMDRPKVRLGALQPTRRGARAGLRPVDAGPFRRRAGLPIERQRELGLPDHALELTASGAASGGWRRFWRPPDSCEAHALLELAPNASSRVSLDPERDELGMPLAEVYWRIGDGAVESLRRFAEEMKAALARGFGRLELDGAAFDAGSWTASGEHLGGIRMAASERDGVVDRDCRVHGVDNLYVASTAVFPVAGSADPMLTLLALTRRLAQHLAR